MAFPQIGPGYADSIGIRTNAQGAPEAYNKTNNQGFATEQQLFGYASTLSGQPVGSWEQIAQGYTPKAQALDQIKQDLNAHQNTLFNTPEPSSKRASSSIGDSITGEQSNYDTILKEYNDLKAKLEALSAPNYQQAYNDLYNQQGIPQINTDLANTQKTIRELPYVNRMNSGNAGVETEGQLSADTTQKGIPLEIQQANLLDRLKLAQDFINNSLKFKEMDTNASRQSLTDALNTVFQTLNLSRTHLNDLLSQQKDQQDRQQTAEQFAFDNRITQPFYELGGTVYRTSDRMPAHNQAEYVSMGGKGDFTDVQKISPQVKPVEVNQGNTLIDPQTGKVIYQAPAKTSTRSSSGGGSSGGGKTKYTATSATSEIMAEWKQGYLQGNGTISSTDYKKAKEWWISQHLSAASFDRQFGYLIDKSGKNWKSDYGYGSN